METLPGLDEATLTTFLLVLARTTAWVLTAPVLSARGVAGVARLGLAVSLSVFLTPVVQTDGLLLDLSALRGVVATDPAGRRATALPGTLIRDFYEPLWESGLALRNQGDIDTQQIAGAVATGTHGSGTRYTSLSGVV